MTTSLPPLSPTANAPRSTAPAAPGQTPCAQPQGRALRKAQRPLNSLPRAGTFATRLLTVSAALCLTACGGGDADTPLPSIEGLWTLTDAEGVPGKLLVLEDGTGWLWTVASHSAAGSTYVDVPVVYLGDARTTSPNTFSLHVRASGPDPRLEQHSKDLLTGSFTPRGSLETAATSRMALTGRYTASYANAAPHKPPIRA